MFFYYAAQIKAVDQLIKVMLDLGLVDPFERKSSNNVSRRFDATKALQWVLDHAVLCVNVVDLFDIHFPPRSCLCE